MSRIRQSLWKPKRARPGARLTVPGASIGVTGQAPGDASAPLPNPGALGPQDDAQPGSAVSPEEADPKSATAQVSGAQARDQDSQ
jgi:hypothetical protein